MSEVGNPKSGKTIKQFSESTNQQLTKLEPKNHFTPLTYSSADT